MILVRGRAGGTALTGTLYERGEQAPSFRGAPDVDADYVWVCDEFYEVVSGGQVQRVDDREVNVAFESPAPRGYDSREDALAAARDHVRTQFQRLGLPREAVEIEVIRDPDADTDTDSGADTDTSTDTDSDDRDGDKDENENEGKDGDDTTDAGDTRGALRDGADGDGHGDESENQNESENGTGGAQ